MLFGVFIVCDGVVGTCRRDRLSKSNATPTDNTTSLARVQIVLGVLIDRQPEYIAGIDVKTKKTGSLNCFGAAGMYFLFALASTAMLEGGPRRTCPCWRYVRFVIVMSRVCVSFV